MYFTNMGIYKDAGRFFRIVSNADDLRRLENPRLYNFVFGFHRIYTKQIYNKNSILKLLKQEDKKTPYTNLVSNTFLKKSALRQELDKMAYPLDKYKKYWAVTNNCYKGMTLACKFYTNCSNIK